MARTDESIPFKSQADARQMLKEKPPEDNNIPFVQVQQYLADLAFPGAYFYSTTIYPNPSVLGILAKPINQMPQTADEAGYWAEWAMACGMPLVLLPWLGDINPTSPEARSALVAMTKALGIDLQTPGMRTRWDEVRQDRQGRIYSRPLKNPLDGEEPEPPKPPQPPKAA